MTILTKRQRTRPTVAHWVLPLAAALLVGGCSGSTATPTPGTASPTTTTAPTTTPSPTTTLIGGQQVSLQDVADIEAAVRGYFDAFAKADLEGLKKYSTGELKVLAGWQDILMNGSAGPPALTPAATTVIDSLEIISVGGDTATAEIKGKMEETAFVYKAGAPEKLVRTDISGPVTVVRGTTWQVANFHRDGQPASGQIYTKVRGTTTLKGVTVKTLGVDLRPKQTVVMIAFNNKTALPGDVTNAVILDTRGKRLQGPAGYNDELLAIPPRSQASQGFLFMKGLSPNTRKFVLQFTLDLCNTNNFCSVHTSLDLPVQLLQ
jgi:hypothetical protein